MKKNLFLVFILFSMMGSFLTSCKEDKPEVPPVVEDVVAAYSAEKLKLEVGGVPASAQAKIELVQLSDKSLTIKLQNVIPGVKEVAIPNAKFEAVAKSSYLSKLSGEVSDNKIGFKVTFNGNVDGGILTAKVDYSEIAGVRVDTKKAGLQAKIYKGEMQISVGGGTEPMKMEQRIYTSAPKDKDTSKMKLQISNFSFEGLSLGDIALDTIFVEKRGMEGEYPIYAFKASDRALKLALVGDVLLSVRGTVINNTMNVYLAVNAQTAGLKVDVNFAGPIVTETSSTNDFAIEVVSDQLVEPLKKDGNSYLIKLWESATVAQKTITPNITLKTSTIDSVLICDADGKMKQKIKENTPIDFSKFQDGDCVKYFVKAQDIRAKSTKTLEVEFIRENLIFDMQKWVEDAGNSLPTPAGFTNSNTAAIFFPMFKIYVDFPVIEADDSSAEITTSKTVPPVPQKPNDPDDPDMRNLLIPGVTAGTLYMGTFELDVMNTLKSTHFGIPYRQKAPASFKVKYRYEPGTDFYKTVVKTKNGDEEDKYNDAELVPGEKDGCSIRAYLYEVANYDEFLDGTNINDSKKVILKASIVDNAKSTLYIDKTIDFEPTGNGTFDPAKKYKIAIVCSSSDRGDKFMGAHNSKLWVKYLEIVPSK